ncbi:PREDICTED: histone-lysine N-methyltransferase ASHH2-like [Lupinus angustifolius]|uniref:histone-lysine N-methyltransferase ASHH2-like n=1 Tax=Lupinus angustifolius TaxID=3871 RepID=UPI00092E21DE|nr:PREDICTED: histone-lysine N-methyltransferase ASHH2-like [Lupinus angustifolius]XP_019416875.1 PREDICTED: histone-lysine N-methyltransferase ASHH2-like [Lupinus angustifolius]
MGSCGTSAMVDDLSGGSVAENHLCSELLVQCVPLQQTCSKEACNELDSNVDVSGLMDYCMGSAVEGHVESASFVNVSEGSGDQLVSECKNADKLLLENTSEDDCQNQSGPCCENVEVSGLNSGGLYPEGNFQDEGHLDIPSESITVIGLPEHCAQQNEHKDDKSNILPLEGEDSALAEARNSGVDLLDDASNCVSVFSHFEMSLKSESIAHLLVDRNQQNDLDDVFRIADPMSNVVEKCDDSGGREADACKQVSPSQFMEVSSHALYTEVESTSDQQCDQKDCEDWDSEEKVKAFADIENDIIDSYARKHKHFTKVSSGGNSPVVESRCEPTLLGQGNKMNNSICQIEDSFCELKNCPSEETVICTLRKPFYPEPGQPSVVIITSSSSKDVPDSLPNGDNVSINNNAVNNPGHTDIVEIDCTAERTRLPSQRNSRSTKLGRKTQSKNASRRGKNNSNAMHLGGCMLEASRKKRSCISKPARSSMWGLLVNIQQFFEQDNELGASEAMSQELGKAKRKRQSCEVIKSGANSSSSDSVQKCSASTTRFRLRVKIGKGIDLSRSDVLIPEAVDALASTSHLGCGSGSPKVADNAEGKICEVAALGKSESFKNEPETDSIVLNGQTKNSHSGSTSITEKSEGDAEEPCLLVAPKIEVESLIEPTNNKGMDPGTSPDSEVINTIPEDQAGEGHEEDLYHAVLGSCKEFSSNLDVTITKRGEKKDMLICSSDCISEDGAKNNRAKNSKNPRRKKKFSAALCSLELPTSTEINASRESVSCKDLSTEPSLFSGEIELGDSAETLKVEVEVKTTCNRPVEHEFSESQGSENLLSPTKSLGRKLPRSLTPIKVSKTKSKASVSTSKKKTTYRCNEKQKKSTNKNEVKGKGVLSKVKCEVEDHPPTGVDVGNHKLDAVGEVNAGENRVSVNVSNLDMIPGAGIGEQRLSPRNAWVRCDDCHKWRRIPAVLADLINETNDTWTCKDNGDKTFADCAIPQEMSNAEINAELGISDEEDAYDDSKNYKLLEYRQPSVSQKSTFSCISTNEFLHRSHKTQTIDEIMVCHCKPPQEGKLGCGDECLNRILNIECVHGTCPCGDHCSNQQFQKRKYASLNWFKCGKKGYGLKALEDIAEGQFLIEYVGEVLDAHAYDARQREYAMKGHRHFYFMTLNGSEVIDASAKGNVGRFINHSCDPNCRTEKWMVNGEICIGLFAMKDIKQDEEVTFDYNYVRVFGAAAKKCYCGSPHCRGYIGGGDPLDDELIVQGDSDDEFPEPVMLTEDGEIKNSVTQSAKHVLKESYLLNKSTTSIDVDNIPEKESYVNPTSAVSLMHRSSKMDVSKDCLPPSVHAQDISQQMEDLKDKPMPDIQPGYAMGSDLANNKSHTQELDSTSLTTVSKVLPNPTGSNRESHLHVKAPKRSVSVKKGKICANPPNGLKAVIANQSQVSSFKLKKAVEGTSNGRFEAVQEKLNELLDGDGGVSKRKDATKRYLKLLLLTVALGDRSNGEAIQSNRDLSMILDALLKTKSRTVLNDIINKNGLQMLHKIMKQYRQDFKKIPILRKLLKVLEYLAEGKILTLEHINSGPPCHGMESFRESMLSLTEHDDKKVHQIARSFRDTWIPRPARKHHMDRDGNRVESHRSFNHNRYSSSHNHRHEQDLRPTEAIDRLQPPTPVTTSVDAGPQEGCSPLSHDGTENKGIKKRKRKTRWDQPAETNSYPIVVSGSIHGDQNIQEDVPPGFPCPAGSLPAPLNSGDPASRNACHTGFSFNTVIVHPKEKFNSGLPVLYGMPLSVVHQYGTPHAEITESWVTAPGMTFKPFPPLPSYPRDEKNFHPSSSTNAMSIDQPAKVRQCDSSGPVIYSADDMVPNTTGANSEDTNVPCEDNEHISKRLKGDSHDLGSEYFRQQEWNNSKIYRPWFRRNAWKCDVKLNNSSGDICSIGVGDDVPKQPKGTYSEDVVRRDEKGGNNI